jgi:uncharacterized caspase-like protein
MRKFFEIQLLSTLILFLFLSSLSFSDTRGFSVTPPEGPSLYLYKDYHALVVGISDYDKWPDLPNAANDAREVASGLKQLGFEVKLMLDPTSGELKNAFSDLVYQMGSETNRALLFYFAGHGETLELADGTALGYIVPKDCPLKKEDAIGFDSRAISMKDMEIIALKVRSKHFIMLFDSCFSGSLFNIVRAPPVAISEKSALPVRQFITAGAAGEQVPDRSVFKVVFLQGISGDADLNNDGYVTGAELGMHLQEKVVNYTRGGQHPQYGKINNPKLDRGDFIFAPPKVRQKKDGEDKRSTKSKASQAPSEETDKLSYIPENMKAVYDTLRHGRGAFVVDDFEDHNLWSESLNDLWKKTRKGPAKLKIFADNTKGANGTSCSMRINYKLGERSAVTVRIGGGRTERYREVEKDRSTAYDLSRFRKISFYLKGKKEKSLLSAPNKIFMTIVCYGEEAKSRHGKFANYYNRVAIVPDKDWKKIEILFDDFVPANWTKNNVSNYSPKPDLRNTLTLFFMFSSFQGDGGRTGSNTVWIDEIVLQ